MPTPSWLSRLELDLARKRQKGRRGKEEEKAEGKTAPDSAAKKEEAAGAPTTGPPSRASASPSSTAQPLSPLGRAIVSGADPKFERQHVQNARLGELLVPVRKARSAQPTLNNSASTPAVGATVPGTPAAASGDGTVRPSSAFAATRHVAGLDRTAPQPLSRDIVLSPKKWKLAGRNVEPLGWFDPFADRFPNMENAGAGRDFTRVPAKFPEVSKAERDENFQLWLDEKNRRARESRAETRERAESGDMDFFAMAAGRS